MPISELDYSVAICGFLFIEISGIDKGFFLMDAINKG